ncbi:hypothetical protein BBO99_00004861 [Phytophthora kernoviae]|uniref:Uncharacterized protein n=1 Tax=Phytophthora kernoviae TaxID=325452 RepID=A0A3R7KJN9_9STRA|nr:hypothetical protein BBI17_004732 [Phytophthora kernoviae]RLN79970.1 hypothetical protein BBO99_00004861 [Phytophthora kernoviae]
MLVKYPILGLSYARGFFAICGGGGSLKSGIKNTVDIYQLSDTDPTGFTKEISADTGLELASGVAFSHDGQLIAVSVSAGCWVYTLDLEAKTMTLLVKFRTDFAAEEESSQTCARFVGNSTILTGGEDGVVRVWRLNRDVSEPDKTVGTAKALAVPEKVDPHAKMETSEQPKLGDSAINGANMVTLTREYRGHTKRIREIDVDVSHRNLVVSSSEDQSCHLWRLTEVSPICKFSKDDALDIAFQRLPTKPPVGPRKHQFRCVRFANSGRRLYTVLTPARGDSILIKWKPETIAQENEDQWPWVVEETAIAGDKPVASLCVSQDDRFVCAAAVSGEIKVFLASTLHLYKKKSTEQHTFAITGMSFVPSADKQAPHCHLVSGGADKNLLRHDIQLEGGIAKSGKEMVVNGVKSAVGATVGLGLSLWMATTLLFIILLFIHAKTALLLDGPLAGFSDLAALRFDSTDAPVTMVALLASAAATWLITSHCSVTSAFFWNGLLCLLSGAVAFFVAVSSDLEFSWQTGDAAVDELLDYKIAILLVEAALTTSSSQNDDGGFATGAYISLNSSRYTITSPCELQEWNITEHSASSLWLHFSSIDLASGAQLIVSAVNGSNAQTLESQASELTTNPISGNKVVVRFVPPTKGCTPSAVSTMTLDAVGYEYSEDMQVTNEEREICGAADTMKNVVCFESGSDEEKAMVAKAKAVFRTQRTREDNAIVTCTAWLWGNQGHIISNNHCFSSQEMVDAAKFEFDVQTSGCDDDCTFATCPIGKTLAGKDNVKFIKSDATLDYSVLQITNDAASYVSSYGYLQVRASAPTQGEQIYIPQQPKGGAKKITKTDDDAGSVAATVRSLDFSVSVSGITYTDLIAYAADTEEGSSGSPVISMVDNSVVGLHRIGDCDNAATPSDKLASALQAIISGNDGYKTV